MIRVTLIGKKAVDTREIYLSSNVLAAFFALFSEVTHKYTDIKLEFGLTTEILQEEALDIPQNHV